MNNGRMRKRGFTLIELLVVVAIIGLLSSIVFASLSSTRAKARNSERKQTLIQLRNAVELYYAKNGSYPSTGGRYNWRGTFCSYGNSSTDWIPGLTSNANGGPYITELPKDPNPPKCWPGGGYLYTSDGKDYSILAWNSVEGVVVGRTDQFQRHKPPCKDDPWLKLWVDRRTYAVQSAGAEKSCW